MSDGNSTHYANLASLAVNDKFLKHVVDEMEQACFRKIQSSDPGDMRGREEQYHLLRAIKVFRATLQSMVANEKIKSKKSISCV